MLPPDIDDALLQLHSYASSLNDWVEIKKHIVKMLPPARRTLFSRRHPVTKLQQTNEFEIEVMNRWEELTGESVVFTKQHEDS